MVVLIFLVILGLTFENLTRVTEDPLCLIIPLGDYPEGGDWRRLTRGGVFNRVHVVLEWWSKSKQQQKKVPFLFFFFFFFKAGGNVAVQKFQKYKHQFRPDSQEVQS